MAIEVDDRPRLAELVDPDRHHPCAEHGPEPRQRVAGGIVHGDDRQVALVAPKSVASGWRLLACRESPASRRSWRQARYKRSGLVRSNTTAAMPSSRAVAPPRRLPGPRRRTRR